MNGLNDDCNVEKPFTLVFLKLDIIIGPTGRLQQTFERSGCAGHDKEVFIINANRAVAAYGGMHFNAKSNMTQASHGGLHIGLLFRPPAELARLAARSICWLWAKRSGCCNKC